MSNLAIVAALLGLILGLVAGFMAGEASARVDYLLRIARRGAIRDQAAGERATREIPVYCIDPDATQIFEAIR